MLKNKLSQVGTTATLLRRLKEHLRSPLYTNAFYLILNSGVSSLLGFAFWVIAARLYSPAEVGLVVGIIASATLIASFSTLGLGFGMIRFLPDAGDKATPMVNTSFTISGLVSIVAGLIFLAGLGLWSPSLLPVREHPVFLISFVLFIAVGCLTLLLHDVFIARRSAKFVLIKSVSSRLLTVLALILLPGAFGAFAIFVAFALPMFVMLLIALFWLLPRAQGGYHPSFSLARKATSGMVRYSLVNYISNLLWLAPSVILTLMVLNVLGGELNAYFYAAWAISSLLSLVSQAVSYSLFAEGSHQEDQLALNSRKALKLLGLILPVAVLVIFAIGDKLLLLFGEAYAQEATKLLWVFALSTLPQGINFIYLSAKRVTKGMRGIIGIPASLLCLSLPLSYLLMAEIGLLGVGLGWLIAQSVVAVAILLSHLHQQRRSGSRSTI